MKIPKQLKFKTKTYQVEFDKESLRDESRYGVTYHTKQKIMLDPTQPKDGLLSTFLHEIVHVILEQSPLRSDLSRDLNEKVAQTIGEDLLLCIWENKLDFRK